MNFKKTFAAATAAVVAASCAAVSSSALFTTFEKKDADGKDLYIATGTDRIAIALYDGSRPTADGTKAIVDYGVDWSKLDHIDYYLTIVGDQDFLENTIGGQIGISSNNSVDNGPKNWCCEQFWGLNDPELGWEASADNPIQFNKVGDWTYKATYQITDDNRPDEGPVIVQLFCQQWSSIAEEALDIVAYDAAGNILIAFDQQGNQGTTLPTDINFNITKNGDTAADTTTDTPAAPATGDVAAATDSSKGSPDTGIEDVAAVAGLALVAAGAVVVAKKRK